jgi:K+-transporting ATPase ATPase A chain
VPLFNIQTGEVIFGGVGAAVYGMLLFAVVAVFIAGLMVGRTPEYLGKKIESKEVKMAMLALIACAASVESRNGAVAARLGAAPYPFPAHQTGRADFPHPAFRQTSARAHAGTSVRS